MMRSLYSAISGLKNHQVKMDVIGNNTANVNTVGFKKSNVNFSTMLSQNLEGASAPSPNQGGTNAIQVGLGSQLGTVDQIMTQGSAQSTGKSTDMMLQGSGFFVLDNKGETVYSRAGSFGFDSNGNLVDPSTGALVQGYTWGADDSTQPVWDGSNYGSISFSLGDELPQDASLPVTMSTKSFAGPSSTTWTDLANLEGAGNVTIDGLTQVPLSQTPQSGEYNFDPTTGTITLGTAATSLDVKYVPTTTLAAGDISGQTVTVDYPPAPGETVYLGAAGSMQAYTQVTDKNDLTTANTYYAENVNGQYEITFSSVPAGAPAAGQELGYDFTNQPHTLDSFSIDQSGGITGVYSDGTTSVTHKIAQIAVANFSNDAGLMSAGNSYYTTTNNSGKASVGAAGEEGRGSIISGAVEMSNVDLAQEFTDMIVTQRGYQANSRIITVSDSLLQELIDLKR